MRVTLPLLFVSLLCACGAREPAPSHPTSLAPPASASAEARSPAPRTAALGSGQAVAAAAPVAPAAQEQSYAELLIADLVRWDPRLAGELSGLELQATRAADLERSRMYLEHRFRQELVVPALRRSSDPVLSKLTSELERIPAFTETPIPHVNLKMGPLEPQACRGCDAGEPGCNQRRCDRERGLLLPAEISAAGLDGDLSFGGHPIATSDGVETTPSAGLSVYLDAVQAAGLTRDEIRAVLTSIARGLVRRSAILEGARPLAREADEPLPRAVLRAAFERWRATYAERLLPPTLPVLAGDSLELALLDGYVTSEAALYQPYRWARIMRLQSGRARYHKKQIALQRAALAGKDVSWESSEPPFDEEACLSGPPLASRRCGETEAASALFFAFLGSLSELESEPQSAEKSALDLALAFEHLTLAGLAPERVAEFYRQWLSRTAARSVP